MSLLQGAVGAPSSLKKLRTITTAMRSTHCAWAISSRRHGACAPAAPARRWCKHPMIEIHIGMAILDFLEMWMFVLPSYQTELGNKFSRALHLWIKKHKIDQLSIPSDGLGHHHAEFREADAGDITV